MRDSRLLGASSSGKSLLLVGHTVFAVSHTGIQYMDVRNSTWYSFPNNGLFADGLSITAHLFADRIYTFGLMQIFTTYTPGLSVLKMDIVTGEWEEVKPRSDFAGPELHEEHASAFIERRKVIAVTGARATMLVEWLTLAVFDLRAEMWTFPKQVGAAPICRTKHSVCTSGDIMFLYGGRDLRTQAYLGDLFALDFAKSVLDWQEIRCSRPPFGRSGASLVLLQAGKLLVIGGETLQKQYFSDFYVLELPRSKQTLARCFDVSHDGEYIFAAETSKELRYCLVGDVPLSAEVVTTLKADGQFLIFGGNQAKLRNTYVEMSIFNS